MNIRIIATGIEGQHAALFPNTSFADGDIDITQELLIANGCEKVVPPERPPYVPTYQELRAREYPPYTDYLDGIVKDDAVQIQAYINTCLAVKAKYPKN